MARFSLWLLEAIEYLRRSFDRDAYCALGRLFTIGVIVTAAVLFIAVPKWKFVVIVTVCAMPLILLVNVWHILRHPEAKRPLDMPWVIVVIGTVVVSALAMVGLEYVIPSVVVRLVLAIIGSSVVLNALAYLLRRVRSR